ncbi:MAG: hypothetical protein P8X64_04420 [Anaerolineales bacterium]|jgi:hypothetical protein
MRSSGYGTILKFSLSLFVLLLFVFLNRTDLGNWFKKSDYAEWGRVMEDDLKADLVNVQNIDFGTLPDNKEEFFVVLEFTEPTYDYELELLFADVHRIVGESYLKLDPEPAKPDTMAFIMDSESGLIVVVKSPFQSTLDYLQSSITYDQWINSWQYAVDFAEDEIESQ